MPVTIDIADDYQYFDFLETITYYVKVRDGLYEDPITILYCLRRAQAQSLDDLSQVNTLTWHIWAANCPDGFLPKSQDMLQAASDETQWIVDPVDIASWSTRYRLPCKKLIS